MKILLTADWHLKHKHPFSRMVNGKLWDRMCQEKLNILYRLPAYADKLKVDMVLIAGDVFDTSNPPEALKAEFVKIVQSFKQKVVVITGRPGDHDYVSKNNYVLMDIKEAMSGDEVYIHDSNSLELSKGVLAHHEMLEGISDLYKNSIPLSSEVFSHYKTILMGDYHAYYHTTFGKKFFIYPGPPYPTRYGENDHGLVVVETNDKDGSYKKHKYYKIKSYALMDLTNLDYMPDGNKIKTPYVLRYSLVSTSQELAPTLRACEDRKQELLEDSMCMDVIWKVKTCDNMELDSDGNELEDASLREVCKKYIKEAGGKTKKASWKLFQKLEKEVE